MSTIAAKPRLSLLELTRLALEKRAAREKGAALAAPTANDAEPAVTKARPPPRVRSASAGSGKSKQRKRKPAATPPQSPKPAPAAALSPLVIPAPPPMEVPRVTTNIPAPVDELAAELNASRSKRKRVPNLRSSAANVKQRAGTTSEGTDDDDEKERDATPQIISADELSLRFSQTIEQPNECACCSVDTLLKTEGAESRGLIHMLFRLRPVWRKLFALYNIDDATRKHARSAFVEILESIGVQEGEACEGLRIALDPALVSEFGEFHDRTWPVLCPNVLFVMQAATPLLLGANTVAAKNFFHLVMKSTAVYFHELSKRRLDNPMSSDTLLSLEREYHQTLPRDVLLSALTIKMGAKDSAILSECYDFTTRQNKPDTHICIDLSPTVCNRTRDIVAHRGAPDFTKIQNELCALLRRPAATISFVDYLWPLRLGCTLENKCIKTRMVHGSQQSYIATTFEYEQFPHTHHDSIVPASFFPSTGYQDSHSAFHSPGKPLAIHHADYFSDSHL